VFSFPLPLLFFLLKLGELLPINPKGYGRNSRPPTPLGLWPMAYGLRAGPGGSLARPSHRRAHVGSIWHPVGSQSWWTSCEGRAQLHSVTYMLAFYCPETPAHCPPILHFSPPLLSPLRTAALCIHFHPAAFAGRPERSSHCSLALSPHWPAFGSPSAQSVRLI